MDTGDSHVVGSPAPDRPVRETQASMTGWEGIKSIGGRCFYYPGGAWAIGLSFPRHQLEGRAESEQTLAPELVHAYLWAKHRVIGHGPDFKAISRARGIPMYCQSYGVLERDHHRQLPLRGEPERPAAPQCRLCGSPAEFRAVIKSGHLTLCVPAPLHGSRLSLGRRPRGPFGLDPRISI